MTDRRRARENAYTSCLVSVSLLFKLVEKVARAFLNQSQCTVMQNQSKHEKLSTLSALKTFLSLQYVTGYNMKPSDRQGTQNSVLTYHRIVEAFKFAYAYRALLGDKDFANVTEVIVLLLKVFFTNKFQSPWPIRPRVTVSVV